ncbi:MAG: hypothetical protein J7647_29405 [Cyanobacteria bacterium SBLK]|nr:hypothetical protein [Cyanobacteria bacterium SBLK]
MSNFAPPRNRDAWSTIRGYVYQVDQTIKRWLDLQPDQILELERGEDIDIISHSLDNPSEERERILEQVKHREQSITLKTPEVIIAIANFLEHFQANPDANLLLRFTTNNKIGKEQKSKLPNKIPGLQAWEKIRQGCLEQEFPENEVIIAIRETLKNTTKPQKLPQESWDDFKSFLEESKDIEILNLIQRIEWSTGATESKCFSPTIREILIKKKYADNSNEAHEKYQRLFLHVFKKLCQSDIKRLTTTELKKQLNLPTLSEGDRKKLDDLGILIQAIESRVDRVEQGLSQIGEEVRNLAKQYNIDAAIQYTVAQPILDIPPQVDRYSPRQETVNSLIEIVLDRTWTAIHGSSGSGKTQLAILLARALLEQDFIDHSIWIRFRDLTLEQSCIRLDSTFQTIAKLPTSKIDKSWYLQICQKLGDRSIVILDDLPKFSTENDFSERLIQFTKVCQLTGVRLLSTSPYELLPRIKSNLGDNLVQAIAVPLLKPIEAQEIFNAYDAPISLTIEQVKPLNSIAQQNPSLLVAIARYLHQKNWKFTIDTLEQLFKSKHTFGLDDETFDRILESIQNPQSQELLYRLSLIIGDFSFDDVQTIASVEPSILRPRQHFKDLTGLWIQKDTENRFRVSPLIKQLGKSELIETVSKRCYQKLGEEIISQSSIDQYDAQDAILYFFSADNFNQAGIILMLALQNLEEYESEKINSNEIFLFMWCEQPLPQQMDFELKVILRGLQISCRYKYGKSINFLVEDLDLLIESISEQEVIYACATIAMLINKYFDAIGFTRANTYLQTVLQLLPYAKLPNEEEFEFLRKEPFELFMWFIIEKIQTKEDLRNWMKTLEKLTTQQREQVFNYKSSEMSLVLSNHFLVREVNKSKNEQNWNEILNLLTELESLGERLDVEILWACAVRAKISVQAEYCHNLDRALTIANEALKKASDDPHVQFLIREEMGSQYVYTNHNKDALAWLDEALKQRISDYSLQLIYALLKKSRVLSIQEPYLAIQYAQQAVNLAEQSEEIPDTGLVKALGELAIAKWLSGDLSAAFEPLERAGDKLLNCKDKNEYWQSLTVLYSNILWYFTEFSRTKNPPIDPSNGKIIDSPKMGKFFDHIGLEKHYKNSLELLILSFLSEFAESINNSERALKWALEGINIARKNHYLPLLPELLLRTIPNLLRQNLYEQILEIAQEVEGILMGFVSDVNQNQELLATPENFRDFLATPLNTFTQENYNINFVFSTGLLPITFRIATLAIHQPSLARSHALDVSKLCYAISKDSENHCDSWEIAGNLMEKIHSQNSSFKEMARYCKKIKIETLQVIGYLSATLQANTTLKDTLKTHFGMMPRVYDWFKPSSAIYRQIVLPYLYDYWKTSLEKVMFQFYSPQTTNERLLESKNFPVEQQAQLILAAISEGLEIPPPSETIQWISNGLPEQFL